MATPLAPPSPGRTPTMTPSTSPIMAIMKLYGCIETLMPIIRLWKFSTTLISLRYQNGSLIYGPSIPSGNGIRNSRSNTTYMTTGNRTLTRAHSSQPIFPTARM